MERYIDISGYEGLYSIDSHGNIMSLIRNAIMNLYKDNGNYYVIDLRKEGKTKRYLVHRLVMYHFGSSVEGLYYVKHIDLDKSNNDINNLEVIRRSNRTPKPKKEKPVKVNKLCKGMKLLQKRNRGKKNIK
jgi:hypothetical protein